MATTLHPMALFGIEKADPGEREMADYTAGVLIYIYIYISNAQQSCVPATAPRTHVIKQQSDGTSEHQCDMIPKRSKN